MAEPMIRFRRDDGSDYPTWQVISLGDIASRVTRKNKNNETDIPLTISSIDGLVDQRTYFGKTIASRDMSGYYLLKNGEFAYNKSYSAGYDFGSIKRLDKYDQGALSTLYICFALKDPKISDFMTCYFNSLVWNREMPMICAEGARNHGLLNVSASDFFTIKIAMPESLEEQQKIASFFSDLDEVISASEEEVAALEKQKKGAMQKIFSQEVRFKKDDGSDYPEWEEDMGCNRINIINGKPFDSKKFTTVDNGNPIIRIRDLDECTITLYSTEKYEAKYKVKKGNILIGMDGDFSVVKWNNVDVGLNQRIMHVIGKNDYIDDFMYYQLIPLIHEINVRTPFSTVKHLSSNTVLNMKLLIPCLEEQQKIADFLSDFDTAIDFAKQELGKWKLLKKGLLQQMFV